MLTDPQIITVNAIARTMPRVSSTGRKSEYSSSDGLYKLTISHVEAKDRLRSMARFDQRAIVVDPLTSVSDYDTISHYSVTDRPLYGFSMASVEQMVTGFQSWYTTAIVDAIFGGQS